MKDTPSIAVIIPTYNRIELLERAIASVLPQLLMNDEIIIVDNRSSDSTAQRVGKAQSQDCRIQYYRLSQNRGAMRARNIGARAARAEWLTFLDSDDQYFPGALNVIRQSILMYGDRHDVLQFKAVADTGSGTLSPRGYSPPHQWEIFHPSYTDIVLKRDYLGDMHRCCRRDFFLCNQYDEFNPDCETYHYAKLAGNQARILYINKLVVHIDETAPNRHSKAIQFKLPRQYYQIYKRFLYEHRNVLKAYPETRAAYYEWIIRILKKNRDIRFIYWQVQRWKLLLKQSAPIANSLSRGINSEACDISSR